MAATRRSRQRRHCCGARVVDHLQGAQLPATGGFHFSSFTPGRRAPGSRQQQEYGYTPTVPLKQFRNCEEMVTVVRGQCGPVQHCAASLPISRWASWKKTRAFRPRNDGPAEAGAALVSLIHLRTPLDMVLRRWQGGSAFL